jgi:hypothetical protein
MYERIQASRPARQYLLPPSNSLSTVITLRNALATPRYPARDASRSQRDDGAVEGKDLVLVHGDSDEELIFDLEL